VAQFQAFFYALSFFQTDGVPLPTLVVEPVETDSPLMEFDKCLIAYKH
jgi:hypothetical protein